MRIRELLIGALVVVSALVTTAQGTPAPKAEQIAAAVARVNTRLPDYARLRRWAAVDTPFTFANGLLTANGRPRRAQILELHADTLESLYPETTATEATT